MKFQDLQKSYDKMIKYDPNYLEYLNTIARLWFGISVPKNHRNPNSMLGGLIKSIIGDIESRDEDSSKLTNSANVPDLD